MEGAPQVKLPKHWATLPREGGKGELPEFVLQCSHQGLSCSLGLTYTGGFWVEIMLSENIPLHQGLLFLTTNHKPILHFHLSAVPLEQSAVQMLPDFSLPYISLQKLVQHTALCSLHIRNLTMMALGVHFLWRHF